MPKSESLAIKNARIITLDEKRPYADSIAITDGHITAIGDWDTVHIQVKKGTNVLDAGNATVVPGLIDSHMHFEFTGQIGSSLNVMAARDVAEVLAMVEKAAGSLAAGQLIFGTQIDDSKLGENRYPTRAELDRAAPLNPVILIHRTGHSSVMNSRGLELVRIPPDTPGIEKDENGSPNGLLLAQANDIGQGNLNNEVKNLISFETIVQSTIREAIRAGITTLHALDDPEFIQKLIPILNDLPLHVVIYPQTRSVSEAISLGLPRIGGCGHSGLDGDIGSQKTAALLEPYTSDPSTSGTLYFEDEELKSMVLEAHRKGIQVSMHAVGDRAVAQGLMAVEYAQNHFPRGDTRHRIEHWEVFNAGLARKARRLGVMVGIQPPFNHFWPHNGDYPQHVGPQRYEMGDPVSDLISAGLEVAGGSDSPVTPLSPLLGIHSAVNHSNPRQRIAVSEALQMYTLQSARIAFEEKMKGTLEIGKLGDLTILEENPLEVNPAHIKDIRVLHTVVTGQVVL